MSLSAEELRLLRPLFRSVTRERLRRAFDSALSFAFEHDSEELNEMAACGKQLPRDEIPIEWLHRCIEKQLVESEPSVEEQIDRLYEELRRLESDPSPSNEAPYQAALLHLRELQRREADRMSEAFWGRGHLDEARVDASIARAKALLADDDDPAARDRSSD